MKCPYVAFLSRINWLGVGMKHWDVSAHWSERQMLCSHSDSWIMKGHIQGVFSSLLYRQNVCSSRSVTQAVTVTCSHQGISHTFMVQSGSIWPPTKLAVGTLSEWRGDGGAGSDTADRVSSTLADVCYEYLPLTNTISSQFCLYLCHCRLGPRGERRVIWGWRCCSLSKPLTLTMLFHWHRFYTDSLCQIKIMLFVQLPYSPRQPQSSHAGIVCS